MSKEDIKFHKSLLRVGFFLASILWGLIFALVFVQDNKFLSFVSLIFTMIFGYMLGIMSDKIIDFFEKRDNNKK